MIGIIFQFGSDIIEVRVDGQNIFFRTSQFQQFADIDGIKLNKAGVLKEFPDLENEEDWEKITKKRFKNKIKKMKTERERADYVTEDLRGHGYIPMYEQRSGFRAKKLK